MSDSPFLENLPTPITEASVAFSRLNSVAPSIAEQSDTLSVNSAQASTIEDLPRTRIYGRDYIRLSLLDARNQRRSWIWEHGIGLLDLATRKKVFWACSICDLKHKSVLYAAESTGNAAAHLASEHGLSKLKRTFDNGDEEVSDSVISIPSSQGPLQTVVDRMWAGAKRVKTYHPVDIAKQFRDALIRWIVICQIAFYAIEHQAFRELLAVLSKSLSDLLPACGKTLRKWILQAYESQKAQIIKDLQSNTVSLIHVSFDLWTSPNSMAMMAVVIHYVDKTYTNCTRLIALRHLRGSHSGENMSSLLIEIIREFGFEDRLGYFVTDNAESNDVCIDFILKELMPDLSSNQRSYRRLRCWGHILNLCANAYLWGNDPESFEAEVLVNSVLAREQAELLSWRKKGPVGKLHNLVVFIRRSPQRRETWQELQSANESDCQLLQDNSTRWNSVYLMIKRALKFKDRILLFLIHNQDEKEARKRLDQEDQLDNEDWKVLSETSRILAPFYDQTKRLQSRAVNASHGAIWEAFPSMEFLLSHIIQAKETFEYDYSALEIGLDDDATIRNHTHIKTSLDNCHGKLDHYYQLMDLTPVYAASVVLHPGYKWRFFELHWKKPHQRIWITTARKFVKAFWEESYKYQVEPQPDIPDDSLQNTPSPQNHEPDALDQFLNPPGFYARTASRAAQDEYKDYCNQDPEPCKNPLEWWSLNRSRYPVLSKMALDLLSIPLMSAECERVFSSAKTLVTERRNALKDDIIEACTVLRYYYKQECGQ